VRVSASWPTMNDNHAMRFASLKFFSWKTALCKEARPIQATTRNRGSIRRYDTGRIPHARFRVHDDRGPQRARRARLRHADFELPATSDLLATKVRLKMLAITPILTADHGRGDRGLL
jgi:hypothetical protein